MPITLESTAAGLNAVQRTYGMEIHQKARIGLEWEKMLPFRVTDKVHTEPNATLSEILQPYQWQYTPKGGVNFDAVENTLQIIKADVKLTADDIAVFWDSWKLEWYDIGLVKTDPQKYSFSAYLYETLYTKKIIEELNQMEWSGSYTAPTAGTAGNSINSIDGLKTKIAAAISAGKLTEIPTGTLLDSTMVEQVEAFCDAIPQPYRDMPGRLVMSSTNARAYWRNYRGEFGTGNGVTGNENNELRVDATNKRIVPNMSMDTTTSDRIVFLPDNMPSLILGTRRGYPMNLTLRWESQERIVKGLGEFYRFTGATYWQHVFVNDQV